jgi:phosphoribosyl 1,2-cyclic phosphodiesterase
VRFISVQSGSNGNTLYVQSGAVRLLFDAGVSAAQVEARLAESGHDPHGADALFISHDHADHIRCAGIFARKFHTPIYATARTLAVARGSARSKTSSIFAPMPR